MQRSLERGDVEPRPIGPWSAAGAKSGEDLTVRGSLGHEASKGFGVKLESIKAGLVNRAGMDEVAKRAGSSGTALIDQAREPATFLPS